MHVSAEQLEHLISHPLLRLLSAEQVGRFAQFGEIELYKDGEEVVIAGTLGDTFYLILSGSCDVIAEGRGSPLAVLDAGEFFGEMSLIEPATRSATVRARGITEVFRIPNFALADLLKDDPVALNLVLVAIVRTLSHRLRKTNELIGSVEKLSEWLASSLL